MNASSRSLRLRLAWQTNLLAHALVRWRVSRRLGFWLADEGVRRAAGIPVDNDDPTAR